jgi:L-2,4-diaminobutyrate decarboxylase
MLGTPTAAPPTAPADGPLGEPPAPYDLLTAEGAGDYRRQADEATALVVQELMAVRQPFSGVSAAQLRPSVEAVDLDTPLADSASVIEEVRRLYLDDAVWFHHPSYVAHLNCPVVVPAVVADQVATAVNSSLDTWDQSAGATLIERRLLTWTAGRLGLPHTADGVFTSGGTSSNLEALLLARGHALETIGGRMPDDLGRLRILASEESHFSVSKAASVLGLGYDAVVPVRTDARRRMDVGDLVGHLTRFEDQGLVPMVVVATAGTTDFGAIDPLDVVADACRAYGVWLHVDAAYGGGLITSRRHRHLLDGIERADSVTVDFHKTFFQPVASSAVLVRDAASLRHVSFHAEYLNPRDADPEDRPNQVDKSLQTTRRFDALKLWWTLRSIGPDRIGGLLDEVIDLAGDVWALLEADPDFEVCQRPTLSTLVFRYAPAGLPAALLDEVNASARKRLFSTGEAVVAGTKVDGRTYLKLTLLNPATTVADVALVLDLVRQHADEASGVLDRRAS